MPKKLFPKLFLRKSQEKSWISPNNFVFGKKNLTLLKQEI